MELIIKAAGIAVAAAALTLLLKKDSPAMAFAVSAAAAGAVLMLAAGALSPFMSVLAQLADKTGIHSAQMSAVVKALGIAVVTKIACAVCSDAGLGAAETAVQLCGAAGILWCAMPLMLSVLDIIGGLI